MNIPLRSATMSAARAFLRGAHGGKYKSVSALFSIVMATMANRQNSVVNGKRFDFLDPGDAISLVQEIMILGLYNSRLEGVKTVIDCGSNIGLSALYFARKYPAAEIVCYEPHPEAFAVLRRNLRSGGVAHARLHNLAVAARTGKQEWFVSADSSMSMNLFHCHGEGKMLEVNVVRLSDTISAPVDLLKLDVEGAEAEIVVDLELSGKLSLIRAIVIEADLNFERPGPSFSEMLSALESGGFVINLAVSANYAPPFAAGSYQTVTVWALRR